MPQTFKLILILVVATSVIISSALQLDSASRLKDDLKINLSDKKITALMPSGQTLSFFLRIENNSHKSYSLISYKYQVLIDHKEYLNQEITLDQPLIIGPDEPVLLNFPVKINYQYLQPYLAENQKQADCLVAGEMYFQDEKKKIDRIPFNCQMDFPLFKFPTVEFFPLLLKDFTLGGAEFDFSFELKNENSYDLLIKKIKAELQLEGKTIFLGELPGDKTLSAGESKKFSLPLMLDFFEQGRFLRDSLEKEAPIFNLKLQIQADSAWGDLSFSLEKQSPVKKEISH
jgi:LEA14-like dessication related protein